MLMLFFENAQVLLFAIPNVYILLCLDITLKSWSITDYMSHPVHTVRTLTCRKQEWLEFYSSDTIVLIKNFPMNVQCVCVGGELTFSHNHIHRNNMAMIKFFLSSKFHLWTLKRQNTLIKSIFHQYVNIIKLSTCCKSRGHCQSVGKYIITLWLKGFT